MLDRPRVCMFVYNNMVHDARVRKEAKSLVEAGHEVTVVAVHEPGRTLRRESVGGFEIVRVSRSILGVSRREITAWVRGRSLTANSSSNPLPASQSRPKGGQLRALLHRCVRFPLYPLRRILVFVRFLRAGLRARASVYHAHDLNTLLMAWAASSLGRALLIYDTHEVATDRADMKLRWWASFLERSLIGRANRVICTTQTRADFTARTYGIAPPTVLRNFPARVSVEPSDLLHRRLGLQAGTKVVLYQGGIQPDRGLEQLLAVAADIQAGTLVFLGSGRLKPALIDRARSAGLLGAKVRFHDAVPVTELPRWTACASVGVQLLQNTCFNHYSSLSNKLLEYLMVGVPVVASDLPEMRRVMEDTGAGVLIDASDPDAISTAVNRLLSDDRLRDEMSSRALDARARYCWEREEKVLVDLYADLLAGTQAR